MQHTSLPVEMYFLSFEGSELDGKKLSMVDRACAVHAAHAQGGRLAG